ncbi:MAG TPA: hypothetical protein PLG15_06650 [Candidatus Gastranaerophilaceae bacterium]|mgnify:CR=1 FL=1|nr:hypothetical protein [Candidatus Gastranaerophilaceae bacterium]HPT42046.1 hypothetical protein [Candidatus Gastranaerophilaceae bacterium]
MVTQELEKTVLSPHEVRNILNADNREIIRLCKKATIIPKKNKQGQTYFTSDEVKRLKRLQNEVPAVVTSPITQAESNLVVANLLSTLEKFENNITDSLSKVIEEKLEGMDEVVVELIRCKTENESLRQKLNELNKENYNLKNSIKSYKSVGLGFYIKTSQDDFSI